MSRYLVRARCWGPTSQVSTSHEALYLHIHLSLYIFPSLGLLRRITKPKPELASTIFEVPLKKEQMTEVLSRGCCGVDEKGISPPCAEATPWASVLKRRGEEVPTGPKCYACAMTHRIAYGTMTWSEVVARALSTPTFQAELAAAKQKYLTTKRSAKSAWLPESLEEQRSTSFFVEQKYLMITASEFERDFGKVSHYPDLHWQELPDEFGKVQKCLLVVNPESPYRQITFRGQSGFQLQRLIADAGDMLRREQNTDLMTQMCEQQATRPVQHGLTLAALQVRVQEQKKKDEEEAAKRPAAPRAPLSHPSASATASRDEKMEEEIIEDRLEDTLPVLALASYEKTKREKGQRGKGPGRGNGRKREPGSDGMPVANSKKRQKASDDDADLSRVDVASVATSVSKARSGSVAGSGQKDLRVLLDQGKKYLPQLDAHKALCGASMKFPMYQARRVVEQLKDVDATCPLGTETSSADAPCRELCAIGRSGNT